MRTPTLLTATLLASACYSGSTTTATKPTPPPSSGKPDDQSAMITAKQFVRAISRNKQSEVRVMLASTVRIADVELFADPCRGKFDGEQTITGERLDVLADCLLELGPDSVNPPPGAVTRVDQRWLVDLELECASYKLQLAERASGGLAVIALSARSTCGGEEGGVAGGVVGGIVGGDPAGSMEPPPPPPPPPPKATHNLPPSTLETFRISGTKQIVPDDDTKIALANAGMDRVIGSFKLCVDTTGAISQIRMLKSTGAPDYDAKLEREMAKWRYRPYMLDGKAVPVCTAVTFIYSQQAAPPPRR